MDCRIVSRDAEYLACWHPKDRPPIITLNIQNLWDWAVESSPPRATQDDMEDRFVRKLDGVFLQELVCIFKTADRIRIRGGACNPYCRHEKIVDCLLAPDEWGVIREFHRKKKIKYLEDE